MKGAYYFRIESALFEKNLINYNTNTVIEIKSISDIVLITRYYTSIQYNIVYVSTYNCKYEYKCIVLIIYLFEKQTIIDRLQEWYAIYKGFCETIIF